MSTWVVRSSLVLIVVGGNPRVAPPSLNTEVSTSSTSSRSSFASTSFQPTSLVVRVTSIACDHTLVPFCVTWMATLNL